MTQTNSFSPRVASYVLSIVCLVLYGNTVNNSYCLDDAMMITQNSITRQGFAGIGEHLTHSFIYGFTGQEGTNAASNHWRPLPLITYSIEVGLWGMEHPGFSHLVNVLLYMGVVIILFRLLTTWLKDHLVAFVAAFLFAIHPVHTEVVANIKGRDELMCLLFVLLSLQLLWRAIQNKKRGYYIAALVAYFLSLTCKEISITFLAGVPVILYFFTDLKPKAIAGYSAGFAGMFILYLLVSFSILSTTAIDAGDEIMNNPFLYATGSEAIATKLYVMLLYLKLLVFPHPLSYDYSYHQVPYVNFSYVWVWVSIVIYMELAVWAVGGLKRKSLFSFAIIMFFITFSISTNLLVETGGIMGERMLFVPGVFAMLLLALSARQLLASLPQKQRIVAAYTLLIIIGIMCAVQTIARNKEWKDDNTLALADIPKNSNSARANNAAGTALIRLAGEDMFDKQRHDSLLAASIQYFKKTVGIYPKFSEAWLNMGVAYSQLNDIDKTEQAWQRYAKLSPNSVKLKDCNGFLAHEYYKLGMQYLNNNQPAPATPLLTKAATFAPQGDSIRIASLYDLGGALYLQGRYAESYKALEQVMQMNPNYKAIAQGLDACRQMMGKR